jgi:sucrose-6-phosphate hydrolase SacC (GH32 family)
MDQTVLESFWLGGRTRLTGRIFPDPSSVKMSLFATGGDVVLKALDIWAINDMWVSNDEAIRQWSAKK